MLVLVANLGSTSFKYRLFNMNDETTLARGGVERIGQSQSRSTVTIGDWSETREAPVPDHGVAVKACLEQLTDPQHGVLKSASEVAAIGFKAVHGGRISGVFQVDDEVLAAMAEMNAAAPAHNPPYIAAMQTMRQQIQGIPLVAAFETDFHRTIPEARKTYAIPAEWTESMHIKKWGFHGASHRYIATRTAELLGRSDARIISCHLGGSSSITGICNGVAIGSSMGFSPQGGLPQNNRVGDLDSMAVPYMAKVGGLSIDEIERQLTKEGGLLGLSGVSNDLRDLLEAADGGNQRARLAIDVLIHSIRQWAGGFFWQMGGIDAIAFTGGIGENNAALRAAVCAGLEPFGLKIDPTANDSLKGEGNISTPEASIQALVIPANEELVVAREVHRFMEARLAPAS